MFIRVMKLVTFALGLCWIKHMIVRLTGAVMVVSVEALMLVHELYVPYGIPKVS